MKLPPQFLLAITLPLLALAAAGPLRAQHSAPPEDRRPESRQDARDARAPVRTRRSSLSDAVRRVQRETGGQVLGAERVQFDGRDINRIKVMDDRGRVRYMDDDPQQGSDQERREAPPARGDNPPTP